ncbi:unnamed protein product, partial [marine sediment metagenome]
KITLNYDYYSFVNNRHNNRFQATNRITFICSSAYDDFNYKKAIDIKSNVITFNGPVTKEDVSRMTNFMKKIHQIKVAFNELDLEFNKAQRPGASFKMGTHVSLEELTTVKHPHLRFILNPDVWDVLDESTDRTYEASNGITIICGLDTSYKNDKLTLGENVTFTNGTSWEYGSYAEAKKVIAALKELVENYDTFSGISRSWTQVPAVNSTKLLTKNHLPDVDTHASSSNLITDSTTDDHSVTEDPLLKEPAKQGLGEIIDRLIEIGVSNEIIIKFVRSSLSYE